jgi:hypothetical protein
MDGRDYFMALNTAVKKLVAQSSKKQHGTTRLLLGSCHIPKRYLFLQVAMLSRNGRIIYSSLR